MKRSGLTLGCLITLSGYLILSSKAQYHSSTDPEKCCVREPNTTHVSSTCRTTRLSATQFQQSISTPNYPEPFAAGSFCSWEIHAMPGRRILMDFRNLHLAPKDGNECSSQRLIIRSPLTGLALGPYCDHDGMPNIVTTGNYIIVELQSPSPTNGKEYKGFQMVYAETVQATSFGLRPPNWSDGMYLEYQKPGPPTRPPRFNPRRTNHRTTTHATRTTLTDKSQKDQKRKTPKERDRVMANPNSIRNIAPYPYIPPPRTPTRIQETPKESGMGTEVIVGIVVGGIAVIAIISVVVAKIGFYMAKKRRMRLYEEDGKELKHVALQRIPYPSPVKKASHLPALWQEEPYKRDLRYSKAFSKTTASNVDEKKHHKSSGHRSDSRGKSTTSKNITHAPASRDRKKRSEEKISTKDRHDRQKERERKSAKKTTRNSGKDHSATDRPKHRSGSGRIEKKPKRRSDRHDR